MTRKTQTTPSLSFLTRKLTKRQTNKRRSAENPEALPCLDAFMP